MVGAPLYPDKEIEWLLDLIISGENATSIRTKFEEVFGRPLRKNQIRYIKNKYGKDPRFNSPLINRRPKRQTRARSTRNGGIRKNYREDTDDDALAPSDHLKEDKGDKKDDGDTILARIRKDERPKLVEREDSQDKEKVTPDLAIKNLSTSTTSLWTQSMSDTIVVDPALQAPVMPSIMPTWPDGIASPNYPTNTPNMLPPPVPAMGNAYGNTGGYGQSATWPSQSGGWNITGSPPRSMSHQDFGFHNNMAGQMGQFPQHPMGNNPQSPFPDSSGLFSSYPMPISQDATMPYPRQNEFQGFPNLGYGRQNTGTGFPVSQMQPTIPNQLLGCNLPFDQNPLLNSQHMNIAVPPELAVPSPHQQNLTIPSIQSIIETFSPSVAPNTTQQHQQTASLPAQDITTVPWDASQWDPPSSASAAAAVSAPETGLESGLTPLLYEPPASEQSSQPSPELTQHMCVETSTVCPSQSICLLHPFLQGESNLPLVDHENVPFTATSPDLGFQPWIGNQMHQQVLNDLDMVEEHGLKDEVSLFSLCGQSSTAVGEPQHRSVAFTTDPGLTDEPRSLLSPCLTYRQSVISSLVEGDMDAGAKNEIYLLEEELRV